MGSDNFSSTLDSLKGYYVNLYVGEEIIKGKLMEIEKDHLVLEDENNYVFYYSIDKIQAITKNTKQFKVAEITSDYVKTQSLLELLDSLKNTWVTILCLNKQSFAGVLSIVDTDFVTLINGEERILVKFNHISKILKGYIKEESSKSEDTSNASETTKAEDKQAETPVMEQETVVEAKDSQREQVKKIEKEATKVTFTEEKNDNKVWAEPIKSMDDKPVIITAPRSLNEVKQANAEIEPKAMKKQRPEVNKTIPQREKESTQRPNNFINETVREAKPLLMNTAPRRETPVRNAQELVEKVRKVQQSLETQPLLKVDGEKKNTTEVNQVEKKADERTPVVQEVGASRFKGEPAPRAYNRGSIFSGWPNRKSTARRF